MDKEIKTLINSIQEKYLKALHNGYLTYTGFLNLYEQSVAKAFLSANHVKWFAFGGYDLSDRNILLFLPDYMDLDSIDKQTFLASEDCPLSILIVTRSDASANKQYTKPLTHRDYLGALMNLGIERSLVGDIIVNEQGAVIFALDHIAPYIESNLVQLGRTHVRTEVQTSGVGFSVKRQFKAINGTVASLRIDNVIKLVFNFSRTMSSDKIKEKKVFLNHQLVLKQTATVDVGDIITVRGYGKCILEEIGHITKKERIYINCKLYQ